MKSTIALTTLLLFSGMASAGTITGGNLLNQSGANQLETWLGLGDLDFTNISDLTHSDTSIKWHNDVHGYTNVISIYDVTYNGNNYLIGGYSAIGHDGSVYQYSDNNFIFNLTIGKYAAVATDLYTRQYAQYDNLSYFATFGGGHDIFGGMNYIGYRNGYSYDSMYGGDQGFSYHKGTTDLFGGTSVGINQFTVNGLESYIFSAASPVPVPAAAWLFGSGLLGLFGFLRRKTA